jgi:two-component system, LuxR family, response regulator FixJ
MPDFGEHAEPAQPEPLFPNQAVYIIDDDPSVRNALLRFLAMRGMTALGFDTAEQFLEELPGLAAGALIVDVQLPGMSGLALLAQLARAGMDWPAVVISGSHEGHEDAVSGALGRGRYLRKPFEPDALLRALHAAASTS